MNLFDYVRAFGSAKGFTGKAFFSQEFDRLKCSICGKVLQDNTRPTCSLGCSEKYRKATKKSRSFVDYCHGTEIKKLDTEEFRLFLKEKYGAKQ